MREMLAPLAGHRHRFRATVQRIGQDSAGRLTVLLLDVHHQDGWSCTDHVWAPLTPELMHVRRHVGAVVQFSALVRPYTKSDGSADYGLFQIEELRPRGRKAGRRKAWLR